jgi:hypothetical protein
MCETNVSAMCDIEQGDPCHVSILFGRRFTPMKNTPVWLLLVPCALVLAGCADGSVSKRDDSRYVTLPANRIPTATTTDASTKVPPGETGRQLSADSAYASTVVTAVSPKEQKQRDDQEKFEDDLTKLGKP